MTTKADLRTTADGYAAKERMVLLNANIREAKLRIINGAEHGKYHSDYHLCLYNDVQEYCNEFLTGVKSEFPDIDISVVLIDAHYTTYRFSWKD